MNSLDCKMTAVACGTWPKSLVLMMSCPRFFLSTITKAGTNQDFPIWINVPAVNKSLVNVLSVEKKQPLNVHNVLFSTCHIIYESFSYIQVMSTPKLVGTLSKSVNPIKFNCPNKLNQKIGSKWTYLSSLECCHLISVKLENEEGKKSAKQAGKKSFLKGFLGRKTPIGESALRVVPLAATSREAFILFGIRSFEMNCLFFP